VKFYNPVAVTARQGDTDRRNGSRS